MGIEEFTEKARDETRKDIFLRGLIKGTIRGHAEELGVEPPTQESLKLAAKLGAAIGRKVLSKGLNQLHGGLLVSETIADYAPILVWSVIGYAYEEASEGNRIRNYNDFVKEYSGVEVSSASTRRSG